LNTIKTNKNKVIVIAISLGEVYNIFNTPTLSFSVIRSQLHRQNIQLYQIKSMDSIISIVQQSEWLSFLCAIFDLRAS